MKYKETGIEWFGSVPEHWKVNKLSLNVPFKTGFTPSTSKSEFYGGEHNWVTIDDLNGGIVTNTKTKLSNLGIDGRKGKLIKKGSLFYSFKLTVGKVGFAGEDMYTNEAIASFEPNDRIDINFLYYSFSDYLLNNAKENIYGAQLLNSELIKNSKILVPPKKEQIAIADYLNKACKRIDEIIEIKEDQIRKIKKFVNSKYFELLTGKGLKSINTNYPWFKTIPLGWQVKRLKSVVSKVNSGVTPKGGATAYINEGIPLIRSQNVKSNSLDFSDVVFIPEETHNKMKNSKVMNGDVLLNITGASLGRCAFASNIEEANVNQHVCIIRPNLDFIQTKYLYYLLKSEIGQSQIFSGFKGSGREGLNFEAIKSFKLPIPPKQEQNSIIDKLDKLTELSINQNQIIQKQIKTLKNYRKSLIHECVTGKKQVVTQTPIS